MPGLPGLPGIKTPGPEDPPKPKKDDDDDLGSSKRISKAADMLSDKFEDFIEILQDERQDLDEAFKTVENIGKSISNGSRGFSVKPDGSMYDPRSKGFLTPPDQPPYPPIEDEDIEYERYNETTSRLREMESTLSQTNQILFEIQNRNAKKDGFDEHGEKPPTEETEAVEVQPADDDENDLLKWLPLAIAGCLVVYVVSKK